MLKPGYIVFLPRRNRFLLAVGLIVCATLCVIAMIVIQPESESLKSVLAATASTTTPVTVVSAANFDKEAIAPDSIVAAFGIGLAVRAEVATSNPLPTELAGTTVKVKDKNNTERLAPLFFVSSSQVNFQIPQGTAVGQAMLTVRSGDGTISTGEMKVSEVAPAIFTANGSGTGVPAAKLFRRADGKESYEDVVRCDPQACVVKPINLGTNDEVFLLLYASGLRQAPQGSLHVLIGGYDLTPAFAPVNGLVGLDQINVDLSQLRLPSQILTGSRIVDLLVILAGSSFSYQTTIEIAPPTGAGPKVLSFDTGQATARQRLLIQGEHFAPEGILNRVIFGGSALGDVNMASPTQLSVLVPFGAATGKIAVHTPQGQGVSTDELKVSTSISGYVVTTDEPPKPLPKMRVEAPGYSYRETDNEGAFVLPVPHAVEVWITTQPPLPYQRLTQKPIIGANRDNHIGHIPFKLISLSGNNALAFGSPEPGGSATSISRLRSHLTPALSFAPLIRRIEDSGIAFEIEGGTTADFPAGVTNRVIYLNRIEERRTPVELPPGVFSSAIAQLAPFNVKLMPGGKLIFPNSDNLPSDSQPRLYRLDQTPGSSTLGSFVEAGAATVSADGKQVETFPHAITESSIFLVAVPKPITTVVGRVLESDGATPVRGAITEINGQQATTDGNGGFILRNVPVPAGTAALTVEASFQRPSGRVDRVQSPAKTVIQNGVTNVGNLVLPAPPPNRPPVIIAPPILEITEGLVLQATVYAYDPDSDKPLQVKLIDPHPSFAVLEADVNNTNTHILRVAPNTDDVRLQPYNLTITATDIAGDSVSHPIQLRVNANRPPAVTAPALLFAPLNQELRFIVSATDPDNTTPGLVAPQTFMFSPSNLPNGAEFTQLDGMSARFRWTPTDVGKFTVGFTARDNGRSQATSQTVSTTIVVGSSWVRGGDIAAAQTYDLRLIGSNLFAATSGGIFLSTNGGASWTPRNNGLTTLHVNTLFTEDTAEGTTLLAGTNGGGVFTSTDNGFNWISCGVGAVVTALERAPQGSLVGNFDSGVLFMSGLGCAAKKPADPPPYAIPQEPRLQVNALAIYGSFRTAYVGAETGVFINSEESPRLPIQKVRSLATNNTTLIAGTEGNGAFCLPGENQRWVECSNGLMGKQRVETLAVNNADFFAGTWGDGLFRSVNQGENWTALGKNGLRNLFISSFTTDQNTYFAGTNGGGVFSSSDKGQNWTSINSGLVTSTINALISDGGTLYAGTAGSGVFYSTDEGKTWAASNNGLTAPNVNAFAIIGGTLFVATNDGVFSSLLSARPLSWTQKITNLPNERYAIAMIEVSGILYVGIAPNGGVFRSGDMGQSWQLANNGLSDRNIQSLAALNSMTLLAGTEDGGIFRSTDGGQNWKQTNAGLAGLRVHALTASGTTCFAGTNNGFHRSEDQGQSWTQIGVGLPNQAFVNALLVNGQNIYAGIFGGLYFSNDRGQHWTPANDGLIHTNVFALAVSGTNLFAGTIGGGVYLNNSLVLLSP